MAVGLASFFLGAVLFMGLLFGSGGAARSRQFAVIGQLASGAHGRARRTLLWFSFVLVGVGALLCFGGVAAMDAERAARCRDHCLARHFDAGTIGPSQDRSPAGRFVACVCTTPDRPALELRADAIPR